MLKRLFSLLAFALSLTAQPSRVVVDATETPRKIFRAQLTIPATPGPMRLVYAKWIPGEHGPTGPVTDLVDVHFQANGAPVEWQHDPLDMFAFTLVVPRGATSIDATLAYLSPTGDRAFTAGPSATENLAIVSWNTLLLFPPGKSADDVTVEGSIVLPEGWTTASPLDVAGESAKRVDFKPASLMTYIDSPVLIGKHIKKVELPAVKNAPPHRIDISGDSASATETRASFADDNGKAEAEAGALFGAYHFRHYDWLLTLSDNVAHFGLEHHESSDDRMEEVTLHDYRRSLAGLLSHEYVHSWNGKYRRPAGLLSPDYQTPMVGDLLWVYEGLTQYLGLLLATRSGLWTPDYWREDVAIVAAGFDQQPGRTWGPLAHTARCAQILYGSPTAWSSLRRGTDFYDESILLWLEVDSIIRQKTNGRESLDDFIRRFHGGESGRPALKPYTSDDIVANLNAILPYDFGGHLKERIRAARPRAPIGGLTNDGWKLVYNDTPNDVIEVNEKRREIHDYTYSLGFSLNKNDGTIRDVVLGLPAAKAGLGPGMKVIAVNGRRWTREALDNALREAKSSNASIEILAQNGEFFRTFAVDYHGGARYPHLQREDSKTDVLAEVLKARR